MPGERILLIGGPTSGKTNCWISIASLCQKLKKDIHFYVLDSDGAVEAQADGLKNVTYTMPFDWPEYVTTTKQYLAKARPQDWFIVDMIDAPWDMVQAWYIRVILKTDPDNLMLQYRKDHPKGGNPLLEHFGTINPQYFTWQMSFLPRNPCNVLCTAPVTKVTEEGRSKDGADIQNIFLAEGLKPKAQSKLAHNFNSIFIVSQPKRERWEITTLRERWDNRKEGMLDHEPLTDFARQYLMKLAGWRP